MTTEPAHTVKHICNSHKPTLRPKITKELAYFPSLFCRPENKIRLVVNMVVKQFYEWKSKPSR